MQTSETLQFIYILSLVLIPFFVNITNKPQTFERKLKDLKFEHSDFFDEFKELDIESKSRLKDQLLNLRKDNDFHSHRDAYRKLAKLIFKY